MNALKNIRAFLIAYTVLGNISFLYILCKVQITGAFSGNAKELQEFIYSYTIYYLFSAAIILTIISVTATLSFVKLAGAVFSPIISLFIIAIVAGVYPTVIRHIGVPEFERNFRMHERAVLERSLKPGGFTVLNGSVIRIGAALPAGSRYHYQDIIYRVRNTPEIYRAEYARQNKNKLTLVNAVRFETPSSPGASAGDITVLIDNDSERNFAVEQLYAFVQLLKIPVHGSEGERILRRFENGFYILDLVFAVPLVPSMNALLSTVVKRTPEQLFYPLFSLAVFLLIASFWHLSAALFVPRLSLHNVLILLIGYLITEIILLKCIDIFHFDTLIRKASIAQIGIGFGITLLSINAVALLARITLQFHNHYKNDVV
ncbi:MAG: hypothetical protein HZC28_01770 [Spirochaetes bacterium]|nr:hypothetical protein [Spirochaetota bacterium]